MRVTATRQFGIDVGHRVHRHESKCSHVHGHRYTIEVEVSAEQLDDKGRVIDFSCLKERIGTWLDEYWDHGFIANPDDPIVAIMQTIPNCQGGKQKLYLMPAGNPTAENLALHLAHDVIPVLLTGTGITVERVRVWETPNCFAEAHP